MIRQIIVYIILLYDILLAAYVIKQLFTIPGNRKLLNQYGKTKKVKKDNKVKNVLLGLIFCGGTIYLIIV